MEGKIVTGLIEKLPAHSGFIREHADRAAWLEARKGRMTGSKAAALFGIGEYLSLYRLWSLETGRVQDEAKDSGPMWRGRELELPLLKWLAKERGWDIEYWPQEWTLDHPDDDGSGRLSCTPDAIALVRNPMEWEPFEGGDLINVQLKTTDYWNFRRWEKDVDGSVIMPLEHQIQTQVETACLGLNHGVLVLQPSFNPEDMIVIPYAINHAFLRRLMALARDFWLMVERDEEPEVDGSKSTWDTLKQTYREEDGTAIILPEEADEIADAFEMAKAKIKGLEAVRDTAKNQLIALIGERTFAQTPLGLSYSYKGRRTTRIDSKALRAAYPQIAKECEKVSEYRALVSCKTVPQALLAEALAAKNLGETFGGDE